MRTLERCGRQHTLRRETKEQELEPIADAFASFRLPAEVQPAVQRKVDAFGAVESQVEASMVAPRVRDHEFPSVLHEGIGPTRRLCELSGRDQIRLVSEELWAADWTVREMA